MKIGVLGGGAWGTALAQVAAHGGCEVALWVREPALAAAIDRDHVNAPYLPGITLAPTIRATTDAAGLDDADALLVVVPAQHVGTVLAGFDVGTRTLVLCAKGIEAGTRRLMGEVAAAAHPRAPIAVLSGPTFAHEVARGQPTAVTLACADDAVRAALSDRLAARGFAEMTRFGLARGARAETLAGLSGLGDLVLTCSSTSSRNFSLGVGLGRGQSAAALLADRRTVAEGAFTAPVLRQAAVEAGVDMPVCTAVCRLLDGAAAGDVIGSLLARPLKEEGL